jgi:tetratricopeptide (TPR) repeat protein
MNQGDEWLGKGEVERALEEYRAADRLAPDHEEIRFWHAVTLADAGRLDEAAPLLREVFARNPHWATLLDRLGSVGLVGYDPETMRRILAL